MPSSYTAIATISNVKKGASSASLEIIQRADGGIEFDDTAGNKVTLYDPNAKRLFDEINALV